MNRSKHGFTLLELTVGMVAGAILMLTCGSLLFFAYRSWRDQARSIELDRDAQHLMRRIARELRGAAPTDVLPAVGQLDIVRGGGGVRFSLDGNRLVLDPDTSVSGDTHVLVEQGVDTFEVSRTGAVVNVFLILERGGEHVSLNTRFICRN